MDFLLLFMDVFKKMILYADFRLKLEIQGVQLNFLNEIFLIIKNTYW